MLNKCTSNYVNRKLLFGKYYYNTYYMTFASINNTVRDNEKQGICMLSKYLPPKKNISQHDTNYKWSNFTCINRTDTALQVVIYGMTRSEYRCIFISQRRGERRE